VWDSISVISNLAILSRKEQATYRRSPLWKRGGLIMQLSIIRCTGYSKVK
jgi:hypothetical protein